MGSCRLFFPVFLEKLDASSTPYATSLAGVICFYNVKVLRALQLSPYLSISRHWQVTSLISLGRWNSPLHAFESYVDLLCFVYVKRYPRLVVRRKPWVVPPWKSLSANNLNNLIDWKIQVMQDVQGWMMIWYQLNNWMMILHQSNNWLILFLFFVGKVFELLVSTRVPFKYLLNLNK